MDAIDPRCLASPPITHNVDFGTALESDLHDIVIPMHLPMGEYRLWCSATSPSSSVVKG